MQEREKYFNRLHPKYETDKARLAGLETQLRQLNINPQMAAAGNFVTQIPILAPINGVVGEIHIKTGSYADMQTPLMEITDNSQIQCNIQVFEKDFPKVKTGQQGKLPLPTWKRNLFRERFTASTSRLRTTVNPLPYT